VNRTHWIVVGGLAAGLAVATFLGWRLVVNPLAAEYADELVVQQDLQKKLQVARDTAAQFDKFKAQAENVRRDLDFYSSRVDEPMGAVEAAQLMDSLGNAENLKDWIADVKPAGAPGVGAIGSVSVELKFKSDFDHLGRFLNGCLTQKRLLVPESMVLKRLEDPSGIFSDTVDVDLFVTVYGGKQKGKP
jgi:hypothetical protein